jgi:hypothetical protein
MLLLPGCVAAIPQRLAEKLREVRFHNNEMHCLSGHSNVGIVIEGGALNAALSPDNQDTLMALCKECKAVVCCRVTPMQKAQVCTYTRGGCYSRATLQLSPTIVWIQPGVCPTSGCLQNWLLLFCASFWLLRAHLVCAPTMQSCCRTLLYMICFADYADGEKEGGCHHAWHW